MCHLTLRADKVIPMSSVSLRDDKVVINIYKEHKKKERQIHILIFIYRNLGI